MSHGLVQIHRAFWLTYVDGWTFSLDWYQCYERNEENSIVDRDCSLDSGQGDIERPLCNNTGSLEGDFS